jgi:hypothetical protein
MYLSHTRSSSFTYLFGLKQMSLSRSILFSSFMAAIALSLAVEAQGQSSIGICSGSGLNNLAIQITEYVGDCPGWSSAQPEVTFIAPEQPTEDRRVRVYNRSVAGEETAYTDREYEEGGNNPYLSSYGSDSFRVARFNEHRNEALAVLPGENDMVAIVYDGGRRNFLEPENGYQEVAVHEFMLNVQATSNRVTRNRTVTQPTVECEDGVTGLAQCSDEREVRVTYSYCPNTPRNQWERRVIGYVAPRNSSVERSFRLVNNIGSDIYYLYASPAGQNSWSNDLLGSSILPSRQSWNANLSQGCRYDFRAVLANGQEIVWRNVEVCGSSSFTLNP